MSLDEIPRRLRPNFTEARKRLLPSIIEQKYLVAKEAFDRGDLKGASTGFTQMLMALSDPDIAQEAQQRPLSDLRVLATGFNDLASDPFALRRVNIGRGHTRLVFTAQLSGLWQQIKAVHDAA